LIENAQLMFQPKISSLWQNTDLPGEMMSPVPVVLTANLPLLGSSALSNGYRQKEFYTAVTDIGRFKAYVEYWTVFNVDKIEFATAHREPLGTHRFYRVYNLIAGSGDESPRFQRQSNDRHPADE
jgi:hypothetical protein